MMLRAIVVVDFLLLIWAVVHYIRLAVRSEAAYLAAAHSVAVVVAVAFNTCKLF